MSVISIFVCLHVRKMKSLFIAQYNIDDLQIVAKGQLVVLSK